MTNVIIVFDALDEGDLRDKLSTHEIADADLVIGMDDDGNEGVVHKDRDGIAGTKVLVIG